MKLALFLAVFALAGCSRGDKNATERVGTTTITQASFEATPVPNQLLTRRVEAALASDPAVSLAAKNVEVTAVDDTVTLRGSVENAETKAALEQIAAAVPGVNATLDKMDVRATPDEESDETIAYSLERELAFDPAISADGERVTIEVLRGVVTLRGTTTSDARRAAVRTIAETTPGVVTVVDELR